MTYGHEGGFAFNEDQRGGSVACPHTSSEALSFAQSIQDEAPQRRIKYAVFDGPWWNRDGECHLFWGDADGNHLADIEWPSTFPKSVNGNFLKARGFLVEYA